MGPTTFIFALQRASATPFCNGFSGPIIARVIFLSVAYLVTISVLLKSSIINSLHRLAMPGFILEAIQNISFGFDERSIAFIMLCSLAPEPSTRIFLVIICTVCYFAKSDRVFSKFIK